MAEHTGIPVERLIIMLRNEPILQGGEILCEHYNMEWARNKKLCDMRNKLNNGQILFVEEGDQKDNMYYNKLFWNKAMRNESGLLKLHINTSAVLGEDNQIADSTIHLSMSKTKTLAHLKSVISTKIGVPVDEFTISR